MAVAKVIAKCKYCNNQFEVKRKFYNRKQAEEWEKYCIDNDHFTTCQDCYKRMEQESRKNRIEKLREEFSEYDLPALTGSEKQIEWADAIRLEFIEYYEKSGVDVNEIVNTETSARFWIDNRENYLYKDFIKKWEEEQKKKKIASRKREEDRNRVLMDSVEPLELKHDGVVEIMDVNGEIRCLYENNEDFKNCVKNHHYTWDSENRCWSRNLDETTGFFPDRAAEIGYALLKKGFRISIHDNEILLKAIEGDYEKECRRWIYIAKSSNDLKIVWTEQNDYLYHSARKISGSFWDKGVIVNVSHYEEIEEWAAKNGFRFTKAARKRIDGYKKQLTEVPVVEVGNEKK